MRTLSRGTTNDATEAWVLMMIGASKAVPAVRRWDDEKT